MLPDLAIDLAPYMARGGPGRQQGYRRKASEFIWLEICRTGCYGAGGSMEWDFPERRIGRNETRFPGRTRRWDGRVERTIFWGGVS